MDRSKVIDLDPGLGFSSLEDTVRQKVIVIKIGGSCLANGRSLKIVLDKISKLREKDIKPILVVSALKGLTDQLLDFAKIDGSKDPVLIDNIISEGEQLSAKIIHEKLNNLGMDSEPILLEDPDFPVITDEDHRDAEIILKDTELKIREVIGELLSEDKVPVVPGFVGKSKDGKITTLGRGASDTTAVVVGRALNATEVVLLKDVPGIMSFDPKLADSPEQVSKMTVEEALHLSLNGSEVICPNSLKYKQRNEKIRLVNYQKNDILEGGTLIVEQMAEDNIELIESKSVISIIGKKIDQGSLMTKIREEIESSKELEIFQSSNKSISFILENSTEDIARDLHSLVKNKENLLALTLMKDIYLLKIKNLLNGKDLMKKVSKIDSKLESSIIDIKNSDDKVNILIKNLEDAKKMKKDLEGFM